MKIKNEKINSYESKLKKVRTSSGMKQVDLAKLTGINVKTICQYEQDPVKINKASIESVSKLADALGCDMFDIIETKYLNH